MNKRERTPTEVVMYSLYLYFLGLSFRSTAKAIEPFVDGGRSYVAVWYWVQDIQPKQLYPCRRVTAFLIDETQVQIGGSEAWVWIATEPVHRTVLAIYVSRHRNIMVAEVFLRSLVRKYGRHPVYSDGGTWYPDACRTTGLEHRLYSSYGKSLLERVIQYFKDRTEGFDDYYPCTRNECSLSHVWNWIGLFVFMHNARRARLKFRLLARLLGGDSMA